MQKQQQVQSPPGSKEHWAVDGGWLGKQQGLHKRYAYTSSERELALAPSAVVARWLHVLSIMSAVLTDAQQLAACRSDQREGWGKN
jgi:hypothetical protein